MKRIILGGLVAALSVTGAVQALVLQDGGRDPGERKAGTTLVVDADSGDEVGLSYNTLRYSAKPIQAMRESAEARQGWSQYLPQLLGAELSSDVDLTWKQYTLPAGTYGLSAAMNDEGAWHLILLRDGRGAGRIPLEVKESPISFDYLTMSLLSAGADRFRLMVGYGPHAAVIEFGASAGEDGEDDGEG